jgi:methionyl-tRNA formyltransferase
LNGDTETGVSIQTVDAKAFDAGKILAQAKTVLGILCHDEV